MRVDPVCLVCLKVIRKSAESTTPSFKNHGPLFRKFVLLSERLLGIPETTIASLRSVSSRKLTGQNLFCSDCETVVSGTCKVYKELCSVQLKLGWRLKQLRESIRSHNQLSPKLRSVLRKRVASQMELPGGTEKVRDIHRQLSRHCSQVPGSQGEVFIPLEKIPYAVLKFQTSRGDNSNKAILPTSALGKNLEIKVEKEIDGDGADEDLDDTFLNSDVTQDESLSPSPAPFESEDASLPSAAELDSQHAYRSKLGLRKAAKSSTRSTPTKNIDHTKKCILRFTNEGRNASELTLTCQVCQRPVPNGLKKLRKHLGERHEAKWKILNKSKRPPFQCYFCHWAFAYEQSFEIHLEQSPHTLCPTKGKLTCNERSCDNLEFQIFSDLNNHFEKDHRDQPVFRCNLCSWPFLNDEVREVHELVHVKVKSGGSFDCPKCTETKYTNLIALQNHYTKEHTSIPDHLEAKVYTCPICNLKCKYQDTFNDHMKAHEMKNQRKEEIPTGEFWTCEFLGCGRRFPSKKLLRSHRLIHKKTQCSKCGKLVMKSLVTQHMKITHKEGQPIPCLKCGKNFFTPCKLKRHMEQMHDQEHAGSMKCYICQKQYQKVAPLNKHLRDVHQVEVQALKLPPKFICTECGKGYRDKCSLDLHVDAKHTEESQRRWNYKCEICLKSFWRPCLLNKHKSEVHASGNATMCGPVIQI